jgi:Wzt C-terminal domain
VVGAYITSVERAEERQLAAVDAKARETAAAAPEPQIGVHLPQNPVDTAEQPDDMFRATEGRWGSREIEIVNVLLLGAKEQPSQIFHTGERMSIQMKVRSTQRYTDFVFGIGLFNADGVCCYGTNTHLEQLISDALEGEGTVTFAIQSLDLTEGTYKLDVAVHKRDGVPYDYHRQLYTFRVKSRTKDVGIYRPVHRWEFTPNIKLRPGDL